MKTLGFKLLTMISMLLLIPFSGVAQNDSLRQNVVVNDSVAVAKPNLVEPDIACVTPPEGFIVSEAYNGYVHFQTSSTILIQGIENVNYIQLEKSIDDAFMQRNKLTLVKKETITTEEGITGVLFEMSFVLEDTKFVRYMVYLGDLNNTLWLNITFPEMVRPLVGDSLLKAIKTTRFNWKKDEK